MCIWNNRNISSCILGEGKGLEWEEKKNMEESRNWKESHFLFVKQRGLSATLFFRERNDAPATFSFSSLFLLVLRKSGLHVKKLGWGDGEMNISWSIWKFLMKCKENVSCKFVLSFFFFWNLKNCWLFNFGENFSIFQQFFPINGTMMIDETRSSFPRKIIEN